MEYSLLKWIHIVSATLLFGAGLGSAFYKYMADRTGDIHAIAQTNKIVVLADWLFTTPTVLIQPISGVLLAYVTGHSFSSDWLLLSIGLYVLAGLCWLPVVLLQIRMRDEALLALAQGGVLAASYWHQARIWFWLGVPAFVSFVLVYYLMIFKPVLWS